MTPSKAIRRPSIHMINTEAETLSGMAIAIEDRLPQVSELLMAEIGRAHLHTAARIPPDTVTMLSTVQFSDKANGTERTVQLVYPKDADISAGRISILTLVGAGLIGLREGQAIIWPDRSGKERVFTIGKVTQPETAAPA